jgi:hypothetical protein
MGAYAALGRFGRTGMAVGVRHRVYGVRSLIADHPSLYLPFARLAHPAGPGKILADDTKIVIDGFTRSASTFALFAFQLAQPEPVRAAHHTHAPAHLIAAAKRGVPALVPVRPPEPTILSQVLREAHVSMRQALRAYVRFYRRLRPYRDAFVIATFDDVTGDFGAVVRRLNDRFETSFAPFDHTEANVRRCFELIEQRSRRRSKLLSDFQSGLVGRAELERALAQGVADGSRAPLSEHLVARPSAARRELKAARQGEWQRPELAELRAEARAAYEAFLPARVGRQQGRLAKDARIRVFSSELRPPRATADTAPAAGNLLPMAASAPSAHLLASAVPGPAPRPFPVPAP